MRSQRHTLLSNPFTILSLSAALAACGGKDASTTDTLRTTGTPSTSAGLRVSRASSSDTVLIEGFWADGGERSNFTAAAIRGFVARIEERAPVGGDATFTRRFQFDSSGQLLQAEDERAQMVANPSASPSLMRVTSSITFRGGEAVRANKTVDGVPEPVQPWDIENVQRHAAALLALARPGVPAAESSSNGKPRP